MEISKKDKQLIVKNSREVKKDCERAIKHFEKATKQAYIDLETAETLIEKFK